MRLYTFLLELVLGPQKHESNSEAMYTKKTVECLCPRCDIKRARCLESALAVAEGRDVAGQQLLDGALARHGLLHQHADGRHLFIFTVIARTSVCGQFVWHAQSA